MSQLNTVKNKTNADQIYYDVLVSNFQSTTTTPAVFQFNESRTTPYLLVPEDYNLSILRFSVDTGTMPLFIPSIQPNQGDVNLTIYSVCLECNGATSGQVFVEWIAQDKQAIIPSSPSQTFNGVQINDTGYYNCYSYQFFIELVYRAFVNAYNLLLTNATALGVVLPSIYPPIINWDSSSSRAVIYMDVDGYDITLPSPITIFMNAPIFALFNSFPATYEGYEGIVLGKNFRILGTDIGATNIQPIIPPSVPPAVQPPSWNAIVIYQEYSTQTAWSPIQAIVFTSNTLPVEPNQVSTPLQFSNNLQTVFSGNNSNTQNIITDLVSDTGLYRSNLYYVPTSEYRLITLRGNTPLYNLDINIYYRLKNSQLIPFRLSSGGAVSLKLAFLRKK